MMNHPIISYRLNILSYLKTLVCCSPNEENKKLTYLQLQLNLKSQYRLTVSARHYFLDLPIPTHLQIENTNYQFRENFIKIDATTYKNITNLV